MSTLYQLMERPQQFRTLNLNVMSLASQLDGIDFETIRKQPSQNTSLLPFWNDKVACTTRDVLGDDTPVAHIFLWLRLYLVLSEKAYAALATQLGDAGEFLPIHVDGQQMYIFNCREYGKEDESLCMKKYLNGLEDGYETLVFDERDVKGRLLFKSKLNGISLYATDTFKQICDENGLEGLRFEEDLLAVF